MPLTTAGTLALAIAAICPMISRPAVAQEVRSEAPVELLHYGSVIAVTDLAAIVTASVAGGAQSGQGAIVGAGIYLLGGPLVHLAHGRPSRAVGSFALRLFLPAGGGLVGGLVASAAQSGCHGEMCGLGILAGLVLGGGLGALSAMIVDAAYLGHDVVPPPQRLSLIFNGRGAVLLGRF